MATKLVCDQPFSAWGHDFNKGDEVPIEEAMSWPEGTLQRRIDNGFLRFGTVADLISNEADVVKPVKQMTKAELVDYAATVYNTELDPKMSLAEMQKVVEALESKKG